MNFELLSEVVVTGKVVMVRCDFNLPIKNGKILDISRIRACEKTINYLSGNEAKVLLVSHLGDPKYAPDSDFSLKQIVPTLEGVFGTKIHFVEEISFDAIKNILSQMELGDIALLENIRFDKREKENDPDLAKLFSFFVNIYVNEAFSVSHRKHASVSAITEVCHSVAGFTFEKEVQQITNTCLNMQKPSCAIVGGAKVSTKARLLQGLIDRFDTVVIGGAMASTFLKAVGVNVGSSFVEEGMDDMCNDIFRSAKSSGCKIILPIDVVVKNRTSSVIETKLISQILPNDAIFDVGVKTVEQACKILNRSKMVVFNGPLGAYEEGPFEQGSLAVLNKIRQLTASKQLTSVIGGGDALACAKMTGSLDEFSFASIGGGAFLDFLANGTLHGLEALIMAKQRLY